MSETAVVQPAAVHPFHEPSRRRRLLKVGAWLVGVALAIVVLNLLGVDVIGWLEDLWDEIKGVPTGYMVGGLVFQTGQTLFAGLSYYGILRAAYPGQVEFWPIVTAYAAGVAMNNFLPANIGTFVTLIMFVAIIPACTFAGAIAAYLVQKIFFTIAGTFVYLYLFLSVPGSFNENLGNISENPVTTILIVVGGAFLIVLLGRVFWKQVKKLWARRSEAGDPLLPEGVPDPRIPAVVPLVALQAHGGRDLPGGFRDPRDVRIDHVGGRIGLARERRLVYARRGGHHAGNQCAGAGHLLRCRQEHRGRLFHGAAADHDGVEHPPRDRARRLGLRLDGREALVSESYTDAKVKVAEQKAQRAEKREEKGGARGVGPRPAPRPARQRGRRAFRSRTSEGEGDG